MILLLEKTAPEGADRELLRLAARLGLPGRLLSGSWGRQAVEVDDPVPHRAQRMLRTSPHVEEILEKAAATPLSEHDGDEGVRPVLVGDLVVGGDELVLAAGPCAVESEEQVEASARAAARSGARLLRGGAFKPRTRPGDFQGLGLDALRWLRSAADRHGLLVVTEALDPASCDVVAEYADLVQIGARTMQATSLLKAAGRAGRPVLLKRALSATLDEWLGAAEYLLEGGAPGVILCERGSRSFETATRFSLDVGVLAAARLLYGGGLVAERYAAFGAYLAQHPEDADPSVARIAADAGRVTAAEYQAARDEVAALRSAALAALDGCDALLVPTAPEHPTLAEVTAAPLTTNARLGVFTNFVNLFDMAGVAMPLGPTGAGEAGVTVLTRAFDDQVALDLAALLERDGRADDAGWRALAAADAPAPAPLPAAGVPVVVFGAHLRGEPLHPELLGLGARWVGPVRTAPDYRMLALATTPAKPLVHAVAPGTGGALAGEEWLLTPDALGRLLLSVPAPLGLGRVRTDDGRELVGFVGQPGAAPDATDVTHLGGWRAARAAAGTPPAPTL